MLLNCSCKSFLTVQLNCWCSGKKIQQPARAKDLFYCLFVHLYAHLPWSALPLAIAQSLKKQKTLAIFRFLPFPSSAPPTRTSSATLPQLGPPRQLSLRHENPHSQTSLQKFRPLHVWLPAQAFSSTVPSSSPKTIKWSSLLNQFSGATIRLPAPGAAIRLPVRPPSDRSQRYWARWCYAKMLCEIVEWKCRRKVLSEVAGRKNVVCKLLRNGM